MCLEKYTRILSAVAALSISVHHWITVWKSSPLLLTNVTYVKISCTAKQAQVLQPNGFLLRLPLPCYLCSQIFEMSVTDRGRLVAVNVRRCGIWLWPQPPELQLFSKHCFKETKKIYKNQPLCDWQSSSVPTFCCHKTASSCCIQSKHRLTSKSY